MLCVRNYEELKYHRIYNRKQFWYYVLLLNPLDPSDAGEVMLKNLDYFHMDSGEDCAYFIPGFSNQTGNGLIRGFREFMGWEPRVRRIEIKNYGKVGFSYQDFIDFFHRLEAESHSGWRYSGECELLLFGMKESGEIDLKNFSSYNLDDIIRNGRTISAFFRETINIGKDAIDERQAKRQLDEIYASMILPAIHSADEREFFEAGWRMLSRKGFCSDRYYFISYSSLDYNLASQIRAEIEKTGIQCWMAPRDIPTGTNYAHIIETAIRNSEKFVLLLSESSIWSVWVEKELLRAIHYFKHDSAQKIAAVWIDSTRSLDGTPMAYPMEGVQIGGRLNSLSDFKLLLPEEKREQVKLKEKLEKTVGYFDENMVSFEAMRDMICDRLSKMIGIAYGAQQHIKKAKKPQTVQEYVALCRQLKEKVRALSALKSFGEEFSGLFGESEALCRRIHELMKNP